MLSVYVYMHIRIYTRDVYMQLFGKNMCICRLCIILCSFQRFSRCVYSVFQGIISSLLDFVVSEKIKNEWELDLVMKNSVWRRLRRAKRENQAKTRLKKVVLGRNFGRVILWLFWPK